MTAARLAALTAPVEDYLKAIYELERAGNAAGTNEIAAALRIAPASVSGMVRRLAEQGLIEHEPYRGARLTDAGRRAALRTLRRHRVIEAYLAQALGYPWDRVHDEAERLEHAASDELVDRMAAAIGEPRTDPHGAPIPSRDGTVDERRLESLDDLAPGADTRVQRVEDDDSGRLRYLAELGITPGARIRLVARAPFGGPITLRVAGAERSIGPELARHVLVTTAPELLSTDAGAARSAARAATRRPAGRPAKGRGGSGRRAPNDRD
ncbi:MAG: metal-dependent transcriptional regulator [Gemmatimonadaceae bacterium]